MSAPSSSTLTFVTSRVDEPPVDILAVNAAAEETGNFILIFLEKGTT